MADIANGTQFSDLPSSLVIEILVRLPVKALLICRYFRKDWTQLYFSDPYFIRPQLETSNTQFLNKELTSERKFRFGWFVDEVSTGNLQMETLDFSCNLPHDPKKYEWRVINSCNGLLCLIQAYAPDSSVYVCNPILGEWISIPIPDANCGCALGFSAKNNQYKILSCVVIGARKYEWKIYTLGTGGHWRSIETNEAILWPGYDGLDFNTFIHGSLHWIDYSYRERKGEFVVSFDFETERFALLPLPKLQSGEIECMCVTLGVINGCLWANFYNGLEDNKQDIEYYETDPFFENKRHYRDGEMWAMKEYGDEKSWSRMFAMSNSHMDEYDTSSEVSYSLVRSNSHMDEFDTLSRERLLFTLNEDEMLTSDDWFHKVIGYNFKTKISRETMLPYRSLRDVTAYNPSFVSLPDFERGEQVIRGRGIYNGLIKKRRLKKESKKKLKKKTRRN